MSVLDASVLISVLLPQDVHHETSLTWLKQHTAGAQPIYVPTILLAEISGPIARRTQNAQLAHRAIEFVTNLPNLKIVALDMRLSLMAASAAADYKLRGADAVYVALALHLKQPLVTWDKQQRERCAHVVGAHAPTVS